MHLILNLDPYIFIAVKRTRVEVEGRETKMIMIIVYQMSKILHNGNVRGRLWSCVLYYAICHPRLLPMALP
jgi:hypothetical protein